MGIFEWMGLWSIRYHRRYCDHRVDLGADGETMSQEMINVTLAILAAIGTWTVSMVAGSLWLAGKFQHLEKLIYKENSRTRRRYERIIAELTGRIIRLEMQVYGSSLSGKVAGDASNTSMDDDEDED